MGNKKVGRILISDFGALADQQYSTRMQRLCIGYCVVKLKPGRPGQTRAFTSCRCPVAPGGGTGPTVSVLSFVGRVPPRGAGFGATDNCGMHRGQTAGPWVIGRRGG